MISWLACKSLLRRFCFIPLSLLVYAMLGDNVEVQYVRQVTAPEYSDATDHVT